MEEYLNIGIIGAGHRAESLFRSLFMSGGPHADLIYPKAVFDINTTALASWKMRVDETHSDWDKFLKTDMHAVIIGTPPTTHAKFAVECLKLGLDVWSEVPMALTMDEIWTIIDAEKGNKGVHGHFSYGENYCYFIQPQFVAMKHAKNAIGDIYYSEGEYTHSVEHYMIEENFLYNKSLDPEKNLQTKPTWRANFIPITYGHAFGPCLYVLNHNHKGEIERPKEVACMGNMKMQKRFNTDNFQVALVKTDHDTIIKFVIGFVLGHHGRIFYSFWGSRGLFMGGSFQTNKHYYYEVPKEKADFPDRHSQTPQILDDQQLIQMGTPHAIGGHGGADEIMFRVWANRLLNKQLPDINVYRGAEMTAPGILAVEAKKQKKNIEIPKFD
jgi:predicted dehydrogenase